MCRDLLPRKPCLVAAQISEAANPQEVSLQKHAQQSATHEAPQIQLPFPSDLRTGQHPPPPHELQQHAESCSRLHLSRHAGYQPCNAAHVCRQSGQPQFRVARCRERSQACVARCREQDNTAIFASPAGRRSAVLSAQMPRDAVVTTPSLTMVASSQHQQMVSSQLPISTDTTQEIKSSIAL